MAFDYAVTTAELAGRPWTEWVRTYRGHARGGPPLERPRHAGHHLRGGGRPAAGRRPRLVSQADWLRAHGIDELVDGGPAEWRERAAIGDLAAVRARSRVSEAEALLDPAGLGAFRVLEWEAGRAAGSLGEHALAGARPCSCGGRARRRRRGSPRAGSR